MCGHIPQEDAEYFKHRSLFFSLSGLSSLYIKVNGEIRGARSFRDKLSVGEFPTLRAAPFIGNFPAAIAFLSKLP